MAATLAERLGHAADARLLIINCDDLGATSAANRAIRAAMADGIATSTTLMVPCPWALDGVRRAPEGGIGVHLTLTCEYPGLRWRALTGGSSLHDDEGFMPLTAEAVWAKADLAEVEAECRAQVDQALAWGVDVTHLDAHMGTMQVEPRYFDLYLKLACDFDLPLRVWGQPAEAQIGFPGRAHAAEAGRVFPDHMTTTWGRPAIPALEKILRNLRPGVTEVYIHPSEDGPELRDCDPKHADIRVDDLACALDPGLRALAAKLGVILISYAPLRDLQRAA